MGAVVDAGFPELFLGQCLRAQTTCTAPAGKLLKVVISLKISICCHLLSHSYQMLSCHRGTMTSIHHECEGPFFSPELYWRIYSASKMDKSLRNTTSNYKLSISGNTKVLIFWVDFYCVLQDNPQFWSVPICDTIHTRGTWRHWNWGRGRKELWGQQRWALEATRPCWCREVWQNMLLCLTGWIHLSLLQKEQPAQRVVYSSSAWQGVKLPWNNGLSHVGG